MVEFLKIVTKNKFLEILLSLVVITILFFYITAFFQGREISFWPPYIGMNPDNHIYIHHQIELMH